MNVYAGAKVFPGFVCRVGGLPSSDLDALRSPLLSAKINRLRIVHSEILGVKNRLSELLHTDIAVISDRTTRNKLIELRRDLYNLRACDWSNLSEFLSPMSIQSLGEYSRLMSTKNGMLCELQPLFEHEEARVREVLKSRLRNSDFQKGLLISSRSLFGSQKLYLHGDCSIMTGRLEQIERGLIRYYSRMAMKATPFGTFCTIIPGQMRRDVGKQNSRAALRFHGNPDKKRSIVLINKGLYGNILPFITSNESIKPKLNMEINQTVEKKGGVFLYLTSIGGKEVFQRLNISPVLERISAVLERNRIVKFEKLVQLVCKEEEIEATPKEAAQYIDKLIEIGFLRFKVGIPEQEIGWVEDLLMILGEIEDDDARKLHSFLSEVQNKIKRYGALPMNKRIKELDEIDRLIETNFKNLAITKSLIADVPFYEDATSDSTAFIDERPFRSIEIALADFISLTRKLAYPRTELAAMRYFFDQYYKDKVKVVYLLKFYEDYFREHFKEHLEKQRKMNGQPKKEDGLQDYDLQNPFGIDLVSQIREARDLVSDFLVRKWKEGRAADEINISSSELQQLLMKVPELQDESGSVSIFGQIVMPSKGRNKLRMVMNNGSYMLGYGKFFSRFLRLFEINTQQELCASNSAFSDKIVAEISGDANFNANLHPPLTEYEISYPTAEVGMAKRQIKCTDLTVEADTDNPHSLKLFHVPTCKYLVPVDLGFMSPMLRPPLFQLLTKFTPPNSFGLTIPVYPKTISKSSLSPTGSMANMKSSGEKAGPYKPPDESVKGNEVAHEVVYRPRVVFEGQLVLSRKTWFVPREAFPSVRNGEKRVEYFLRVNDWRIENKIPEEVYVRITPLPEPNVEGVRADSPGTSKSAEEGTEQDTIAKSPQANVPVRKQENDQNPAAVLSPPNKTPHKFSRDYYKPQFIDFSNPLLVDLFGKLVINLKNFRVAIEERYPAPCQLPSYDNESYSTEQLFQINFLNVKEASIRRGTRGSGGT